MTPQHETVTKLLPCPFCAGEAQVSREDRMDSSTTCVHCKTCGNQGFAFTWLGSPVEAEQKAVARWNTRSPPPDQPETGLSDEEREALIHAASYLEYQSDRYRAGTKLEEAHSKHATTLRNLAARGKL